MQTAGREELEDRVHLPQAPAGLEESSRLSRWESQQVPVLRNSKKLSHRGAGGITHASWNCLSELGCGHIPVWTGVNLEERGEKRDKGYYCFPAHLHSSKDQSCFQHLPWDHGSTWWHTAYVLPQNLQYLPMAIWNQGFWDYYKIRLRPFRTLCKG